jgi:thiamine biosynthesis protein ThiI
MGTPLTAVNFAAVEQRIRDGAPPEWATVLLRMAMLDCASTLAERHGCRCLVTGESLAQVASQTLDNIRCTDSRARLPVLRPLIGMDKEDIIKTAVRIGTYETSVLPYTDCCALFSPPHPVLRGDPAEAAALYGALALPPLLADALNTPN